MTSFNTQRPPRQPGGRARADEEEERGAASEVGRARKREAAAGGGAKKVGELAANGREIKSLNEF